MKAELTTGVLALIAGFSAAILFACNRQAPPQQDMCLQWNTTTERWNAYHRHDPVCIQQPKEEL